MTMTRLLPSPLRRLIQRRHVDRHVDEQLPQYRGYIPQQRGPSKS